MELQNSFDNGTDGVEITPANSVASGDPFTTELTVNAFYDTRAFVGALGAKLFHPNYATLVWDLADQPAALYLRAFVWLSTGAVNAILGEIQTDADLAYLLFQGGVLTLETNNEGSQPFTAVPPRETWFRLELGLSAGQVEGRYFVDPNSVVPTEIVAGTDFVTPYLRVSWYSITASAEVYVDEVGFRDTDWWGPLTVGGDPPLLGGRRKTRQPRNPRRYYV